jgi:fluoroquinolone resistance protein
MSSEKFNQKYDENNLAELCLEPHSVFEDCQFIGINFSDFNFKSVSFTDCQFKNCNLANQDLTNVVFRSVQFESCNLIGINFCILQRLDTPEFLNCKMNFSSFQQLKLKKIKLINCQALDVDFSGCDLSESVFTSSMMAGSNFNGASLINADFRLAKDYLFDLRVAKVKGLKLSMPEALSLIQVLDVSVEY